jgi:outer membrane protein assembly factor BamB
MALAASICLLNLCAPQPASAQVHVRRFSVPFPLGMASDGTYLWVVDSLSGEVLKLDENDGTVLATYPIFGASSGADYIVFDGSSMWISSYFGGLAKVRASDGRLLGFYDGGINPLLMAFDGANVWVTNGSGNTVTKVRASDGVKLGTFPAGNSPSFITFDGTNIWVTNAITNMVTELAASDGSILASYDTGAFTSGIGYENGHIWVSHFDEDTVTELSASDGTILGTFEAGATPTAIAITPTKIWVTNDVPGRSHAASLLLDDGTKADHPWVGTYPHAIYFDGKNIWISNEQNQVVKISGNV